MNEKLQKVSEQVPVIKQQIEKYQLLYQGDGGCTEELDQLKELLKVLEKIEERLNKIENKKENNIDNYYDKLDIDRFKDQFYDRMGKIETMLAALSDDDSGGNIA
jgi:hypothetical protein